MWDAASELLHAVPLSVPLELVVHFDAQVLVLGDCFEWYPVDEDWACGGWILGEYHDLAFGDVEPHLVVGTPALHCVDDLLW